MLMSRRDLLGHAAGCACGLAAGGAGAFVAQPAATPSPAAHGEVRLLDGPMKAQFDHQQALYLGLDDDALLKPFRKRSGLAAPGADLGGWYDDSTDFHFTPGDPHVDFHGYIAGHTFGQWISGLSRGYQQTRDVRVQAKVRRLVEAYAPTVSPKFFDDYNLPAYTFDKLLVGLIDAHEYAGVGAARPTADALVEAALPYLPEKALTREARRARPYKREAQIWDETYTLPENLLLAYRRGFGERYRALGARFLMDQELFDPLSRGENVFGGKHAYSHVNALSSAAQAHLTLGDPKHLLAAVNGFRMIEGQSYATGGWGPNETLAGDDSRQNLFDSLTSTHASFETPCGAYGQFKITRYLLTLTGEARWGDSMERVLYNTILGAIPTQPDGRTFYYSDYNQHARKGFHNDKWPCCAGTFVQLAADYGMSAYLKDEHGLWVNLYTPSELKTQVAGRAVTLVQTTDYPRGDVVRIRLTPSQPCRFALRLRIPAWAGPRTRLRLNGQSVPADLTPGRFASLTRTWRPDDLIELVLDQPLRLEPLSPTHPELAALLKGPRVLFAAPHIDASLTRAALLSARREAPESETWRVAAGGGDEAAFKPFTAIGDEPYRLYNLVAG